MAEKNLVQMWKAPLYGNLMVTVAARQQQGKKNVKLATDYETLCDLILSDFYGPLIWILFDWFSVNGDASQSMVGGFLARCKTLTFSFLIGVVGIKGTQFIIK